MERINSQDIAQKKYPTNNIAYINLPKKRGRLRTNIIGQYYFTRVIKVKRDVRDVEKNKGKKVK